MGRLSSLKTMPSFYRFNLEFNTFRTLPTGSYLSTQDKKNKRERDETEMPNEARVNAPCPTSA